MFALRRQSYKASQANKNDWVHRHDHNHAQEQECSADSFWIEGEQNV